MDPPVGPPRGQEEWLKEKTPKKTEPRSPQHLVELFEAVLPDDPSIVRRPTFGSPALYVNGNMFCVLHKTDFVLRLDEADRVELIGSGGKPFSPMPGKPMREYVVAPEALLADTETLKDWITLALNYGKKLRPKEPKEEKEPKKLPAKKAAR
jgi:TfoX/Sxy family transcriptional regulator of competence genes